MRRRNKMNEKKSTFVSAKQKKKQRNSVTWEVPLEASSLILCIALNISARCLWKFKALFADFLSCSFVVSKNGKKGHHTKDNNKKTLEKVLSFGYLYWSNFHKNLFSHDWKSRFSPWFRFSNRICWYFS